MCIHNIEIFCLKLNNIYSKIENMIYKYYNYPPHQKKCELQIFYKANDANNEDETKPILNQVKKEIEENFVFL
jgi:hypothetical protein